MKTIRDTRSRTLAAPLVFAVWAALVAPAATASADALNIGCANGIRATVYTADFLLGRTIVDGTRGKIDIGDGTVLHVVTDVEDPLIINKGDGRFHPFPAERVIDELHDIAHPQLGVDVDIYILPFPRSNLLVSSTSGHRVFLSPHVYEPSDESVAYIVAHEMGHVFQNRYMPQQHVDRWDEYRALRGIENEAVYYATASHAYRPVEIFAEDFRVLYGSETAQYDGRIENTELALPSMVPGLYAFFATLPLVSPDAPAIVSVNTYPNPFNPTTEFEVLLSRAFLNSGEPVSVRIYDVGGALVRELFASPPASPEVRVRWDGRNDDGTQVASSTYFGVVRAGKNIVTRKLAMIK